MLKLSDNFTRSEFKCNCGSCDYDTVDAELVVILQDLHDHFDAPVKVTSGNRCPDYNMQIGGAKNSYHPRGRAADVQVAGVLPGDVYAYLVTIYPSQYGIGKYNSFTHIDTRSTMARWGD